MPHKPFKAVIPAAGLGTRFLPATKAMPKEMLPVVDKPAIQYVVEEAAQAGITDILVIIGRNKNAISNHFDSVPELEVKLKDKGDEARLKRVMDSSDMADIHFVRQGDPKGLGHAVLRARAHVGDSPFAVMLGDDLIDERDLVLLGDQDRARWDAALIAEGQAALLRAAQLRRPGRWQLHAAIAACHADAATPAQTDWPQVVALYDMLGGYDRSPVVRLNRAVALAEVEGAAVALAEVDALQEALSGYHLWHAVRARMLDGVGREEEALAEDMCALELTANEAERRLLAARVAR